MYDQIHWCHSLHNHSKTWSIKNIHTKYCKSFNKLTNSYKNLCEHDHEQLSNFRNRYEKFIFSYEKKTKNIPIRNDS